MLSMKTRASTRNIYIEQFSEIILLTLRYTNTEYTDMLLVFGLCEGNTPECVRVYSERFPNRHMPSHPTFGRPVALLLEQYLYDVFEAIISTLDSKLQRIENLDKAVEHLMRRVESLDTRVNNNIDKTEAVISKLRTLDYKLFSSPSIESQQKAINPEKLRTQAYAESEPHALSMRLISLDQKVSDIDNKLNILKNQLDSNYLPNEDINVEASERKPVSMNVVEITKALNSEVINHITKELNQLREVTGNVDRKLQFHINLVNENLGKVLHMMSDVHEAIVEPVLVNPLDDVRNRTTTTPQPILLKSSKLDSLVKQMKPIINVSEKMDEVWDVVVGTKSSVDDLVPKSDELLTQTQRQERAIGEMHSDFRSKANQIIENLDMVEKRLKKQEDDVATLAQRPVPAELLLDPTIDRLVEFNPNRYQVDEFASATDTTIPIPFTTLPPPTTATQTTTTTNATPAVTTTQQNLNITEKRMEKRKGGVIFPSVKNKPSITNNTFTTDLLTIKDIKVIQRRDDFNDPRENFNRDWNDYKNGFGDPSKEFWLGNENIYMLTNNEEYILRVELEDFEGNKRYAQYSHFKIYSEAEYYKLEIDGYEGNAGDSLNDPWYGSNNSPFSTYNRDNDRSSLNCASMLKGGWWWKSCGRGLNGLYLNDPQDLTARQGNFKKKKHIGIVWFRWRGWDYTLKKAMMMIKPKGFVNTT
ncbi:fibrinogen/tenascin/angiopoeitin [Holotrichia oblita]|uniref:Fibrinogen/tenascin/angiopoeitin n=1 Tax=Holotrichia oblita TaxID=644536 RepID=A0ACB9TUA6_HOLOL|nr:fibrinogen/tenascin/angiopoeitin [Holotrichia oblita]